MNRSTVYEALRTDTPQITKHGLHGVNSGVKRYSYITLLCMRKKASGTHHSRVIFSRSQSGKADIGVSTERHMFNEIDSCELFFGMEMLRNVHHLLSRRWNPGQQPTLNICMVHI